ncbi:hypothetical protein P9E76_11885 [Schinkia azotoformans]|uniref:Uncharacterized protein n=1 Tax=Schinkia azotoformans LMG 9581 TaxID=1131731 RepID=K6D3D6_SCHAZ|nr:hypothetical protein [Schinkia azotoformans]EKN62779.1 hypothetical protein BAZO_20218 [Schinkia azotoformans LMG 9581]MEC1639155.1 hypothetical protein [Schinkia azotoformans]MEC1945743.1 hypothetical protein [Schinkia azotoformans]
MEELIKQLMGQMNNRFDKLEQETGQMNKRFDKLEQDIEGVKQEIVNNQTENRSYFKHIETKIRTTTTHI